MLLQYCDKGAGFLHNCEDLLESCMKSHYGKSFNQEVASHANSSSLCFQLIYHLRCINLDAHFNEKPINHLIEEARHSNGWLIFNTLDVTNDPSPYGCTPELLHSVVAAVANSGIEILPIKHALGRAMFRPTVFD